MKLPNGDNAIVDAAKLYDYCLSDDHPHEKHKARVFASRLGLSQDDAEFLKGKLLAAAIEEDAQLGNEDGYGRRFVVDFTLKTDIGEATIRSSWIIRRGEDMPRLATCCVL